MGLDYWTELMYSSNQKELFNVAYVHAMAAQAGLNHGSMKVDDDSVDLIITGTGFGGGIRNPQLHLQLKCTSQNMISGPVIKFPLPRKNYDDLRGDGFLSPRYLIVMLVPKDVETWALHNEDHMILNHCCYWASIKDYPETTNETKVTVEVPLSQRLTPAALRKLMKLASKRGVV